MVEQIFCRLFFQIMNGIFSFELFVLYFYMGNFINFFIDLLIFKYKGDCINKDMFKVL